MDLDLYKLLKKHKVKVQWLPPKKPTKEVLSYIKAIKKGRKILDKLSTLP